MFFETIFRRLQEQQVDYLVVGGVAVVLHGVVRMTADLDLMVALDRENLLRFIKVMEEAGFRPRLPVAAEDFAVEEIRTKWRDEKGMEVFSFYHPQEMISLVDVFVHEPLPYRELRERAEQMKLDDITIPVAAIDDLISLKRRAGRPQDLEDIRALEALRDIS
jgi:predicted nucleotidyltransferase